MAKAAGGALAGGISESSWQRRAVWRQHALAAARRNKSADTFGEEADGGNRSMAKKAVSALSKKR